MNGRFEEKLARIAFGDASPEEIARMERRAQKDPAAARVLAEFRQMKAELRNLAETPAHQLSNERLREAILARGLHPKPLREPQGNGLGGVGLGAGWLWMPVAAALLGVAMVNLRHRPAGGEARVVIEPSHVAMHDSTPFRMPAEGISPVAKSWVADRDAPPEATAASLELPSRSTMGTVSRGAHHRRRRNAEDFDTLSTWDRPDKSSKLFVQDVNPWAKSAARPSSTAPGAAATPRSTAPIVLIDSDPDSQTGAPGATEVGSASNVVIGG